MKRAIGGGLGLSALLAGTALAQAPVPPRGALAPPTREEINRGQPTTPPPSRPRLRVEGEIEHAPCPLADPRFAAVTVTLSEVRFNGLKAVDPTLLRSAYADFLGKTVPIATVCEVRDAAATILRDQGYLAAVQVPPQRIENGVLTLDVLMAKLVGIQVRGNAGKSERLIAGYLEKLKEGEAFNQKEAERYLLLARDLPGYDVRLTLRPAGTVPGEVIGEVAVVRQPFAVDFNAQNYGARDVGRIGGLLRGEAFGLLGLGDRLSLGVFSTADFEEQQVVQGAYDFRLGSEGLTIGTRLTHAWTRPDIGRNLDLRSRTLIGGMEARYPFIRSQSANLRGALGFDYVNQRVRFGGALFNEDKLRVAYLRVDLDAIDPDSLAGEGGFTPAEPKWRGVASFEFRRGLDILDATKPCVNNCQGRAVTPSRAEGNPVRSVARLSGLAEFRPARRVTLAILPSAQYAWAPLLSYEEISGGNYTFGRGYDPGAIIGDRGFGFQSEVRFGSVTPRRSDDVAFQPFAFFDLGRVWNRDLSSRVRDPLTGRVSNPAQKLESAGGGVRMAIGDKLRLDAALAIPLRRAGLQAEKPDPRLLISLTTRLLPW